jgi:hypothetical protein
MGNEIFEGRVNGQIEAAKLGFVGSLKQFDAVKNEGQRRQLLRREKQSRKVAIDAEITEIEASNAAIRAEIVKAKTQGNEYDGPFVATINTFIEEREECDAIMGELDRTQKEFSRSFDNAQRTYREAEKAVFRKEMQRRGWPFTSNPEIAANLTLEDVVGFAALQTHAVGNFTHLSDMLSALPPITIDRDAIREDVLRRAREGEFDDDK